MSGAHFNPAVSLADWFPHRRHPTGLTGRELAAYVPAQTAGAIGGAMLANLMFALPAVTAGRALSDTFAGITPASVPAFIAAQLAGAVIGVLLLTVLYPPTHTAAGSAARAAEPTQPSARP